MGLMIPISLLRIRFCSWIPSMNRAYSLVFQIEQQHETHISIEMNAFNLESKKTNVIKKSFDKKKTQHEKRNFQCEHSKRKGHG